jgi:tRNA threonylcarbamoyladenosine biosynthesis protein TsaB
MIILSIRTDNPAAELGLHEGEQLIDTEVWQAHRELSMTILGKIRDILARNQIDFKDVNGILVFQGPGSFTGLRIGITVANTLSYSLQIPIVGASTDNWISRGRQQLEHGEHDQLVQPEYGRQPHITKPKR